MIPSISISDGKPVIFLPLSVVLTVSALKDLFEDLKKHKQDRAENRRDVQYIDPSTESLQKIRWENLHVGNIVKSKYIYNNKNIILIFI